MGPPPSSGDEMNYDILAVEDVVFDSPSAGLVTIELDGRLRDEENRFDKGFVEYRGKKICDIVTNTDNLFISDSIVCSGWENEASVVGSFVYIYDDDYTVTGRGDPIEFPWMLASFDTYTNAITTQNPRQNSMYDILAEAYILPIAAWDWYRDEDVIFKRNLGKLDFIPYQPLYKIGPWRDIEVAKKEFWSGYFVATLQGDIGGDRDPDKGADPVRGETPHWKQDGRAAIYVEVSRELDSLPQAPLMWEALAILHELGHMGGARHEDGGIMKEDECYPKCKYMPISIRRFRSEEVFGCKKNI